MTATSNLKFCNFTRKLFIRTVITFYSNMSCKPTHIVECLALLIVLCRKKTLYWIIVFLGIANWVIYWKSLLMSNYGLKLTSIKSSLLLWNLKTLKIAKRFYSVMARFILRILWSFKWNSSRKQLTTTYYLRFN